MTIEKGCGDRIKLFCKLFGRLCLSMNSADCLISIQNLSISIFFRFRNLYVTLERVDFEGDSIDEVTRPWSAICDEPPNLTDETQEQHTTKLSNVLVDFDDWRVGDVTCWVMSFKSNNDCRSSSMVFEVVPEQLKSPQITTRSFSMLLPSQPVGLRSHIEKTTYLYMVVNIC